MNDSYHIEELEIRISNYLSGNCTEEEKEALFAYLASNEDAAKIFREMSAVWAVSSVPAFAKVEDANLSQIKEKIAAAEMKPVRSRKIVPVWLKVAAAIILLLGCNYFWYTYTENLTEVYTNADSPERDVTLDGEGYFKVAKNEKIPFFVNTNGVQVKVVGTVFNVRAYDDDNYVMVSLLEGRVNLATLSGSVMKLFPSEQAFTIRIRAAWRK